MDELNKNEPKNEPVNETSNHETTVRQPVDGTEGSVSEAGVRETNNYYGDSAHQNPGGNAGQQGMSGYNTVYGVPINESSGNTYGNPPMVGGAAMPYAAQENGYAGYVYNGADGYNQQNVPHTFPQTVHPGIPQAEPQNIPQMYQMAAPQTSQQQIHATSRHPGQGFTYGSPESEAGRHAAAMDSAGKDALYNESVKKTKPRKSGSMKRFIAGLLIISLVGGPLAGLCIGAGKTLAEKYILKEDAVETSMDTENSVQNSLGGTETPTAKDSEEKVAFTFPETNAASSDWVIPGIIDQQLSVVEMIEAVEPSVVNISTKVVYHGNQGYFGNRSFEETYSGSGIVFNIDDENVYIVTNNHVIEDASNVFVSVRGEEQIAATFVGNDANSDLAVISILRKDLADIGILDVKAAVFGDSDDLKVGEATYAIGNALGEGKIVTDGILSALNKNVIIDGNTHTFVQTSAAINPGNSGGALVNGRGEVIGINTAKIFSSRVEGIGYAIPSNTVKPIIEAILNEGAMPKQPTPYLGIKGSTVDESIANMYNLPLSFGVIISDVTLGSGADKAGLEIFDVIISLDGQSTSTIEELQNAVSEKNVGDIVELSVIRNGRTISISVELKDMNDKWN